MQKRLRDRELNPGLPRDRRGYLPLYYRGCAHCSCDLRRLNKTLKATLIALTTFVLTIKEIFTKTCEGHKLAQRHFDYISNYEKTTT